MMAIVAFGPSKSRGIVGTGNLGPLVRTSWWSGGDSNLRPPQCWHRVVGQSEILAVLTVVENGPTRAHI
jgi:hypothetical protein